MEKKNINKINGIFKYFKELSIIVVGILITFFISTTIEKKKNEKDVNFYLSNVKDELQENLKTVNDHIDYYESGLKFRDIILEMPYDKIPEDTIMKYSSAAFSDPRFPMSDYAWDLFKASGKTDLMDDKALLFELMKCYKIMHECKAVSDYRAEIKTDLVVKYMGISNDSKEREKKGILPKEKSDMLDYMKNIHTKYNSEYISIYKSKEILEKLISKL